MRVCLACGDGIVMTDLVDGCGFGASAARVGICRSCEDLCVEWFGQWLPLATQAPSASSGS